MLTFREVSAKLDKRDITIAKKDTGEYRVNFRGGKEETAYYTDDLQDALDTGVVMSVMRRPLKVKARRFTKEDWEGYAGAEKFPDGSEPFFTQRVNKSGSTVDMIATSEGVDAYIFEIIGEQDNTTTQWYRLAAPLSAKASEAVLNALPEVIDETILKEWGFTFIMLL